MANSTDAHSWVETHENPFALIDKDYRIVAVNRAFERKFEVDRNTIIGKLCFEVSHRRDRPCHDLGDECPYEQVFQSHQPHTCLHTHYDGQGHMHWVRVNVYPVTTVTGETYIGESMQEIAVQDIERLDRNIRMVGKSPVFLKAIEQLELAAQPNAPVLLLGETGTGKELAAAFIHRHSQRRDHPFLAVDCTVLTESLFESEVFGHERGAYTGSVGFKKGLFEMADGGTLFLDEIGEMPLSTQAKLLRVLETGEFRRVGGQKTLKADVRIVCATNRHLWDSVKMGGFREDLYYRIACFCIRMPALRDRLEDIPILAESILACIAQSSRMSYRLQPEAVRYLQQYHYPGNVRELRNILQIAAAHCPTGEITIEPLKRVMQVKEQLRTMLPPSIERRRAVYQAEMNGAAPLEGDLRDEDEEGDASLPNLQSGSTMQAIEARYIADLLKQHGGHRLKVAKALGISERTLYRKLKRYGLT